MLNGSRVTKWLTAKRPAREIYLKQLEVGRSVTETILNTITNTLEGQACRVAFSKRKKN